MRIDRTVSDRPVTRENAHRILNEQVIPVLKRVREAINSADEAQAQSATGDGVAASSQWIPLAEVRACVLELEPGGVPIFSGADHGSQGLAWVRVNGVPNLFLGVRAAGSSYMADERIRIVRFVYSEHGETLLHTEFSQELQIGHGQSLTAFADATGAITLYCSVYTGDSGGVSVQKGFTRIRWNGPSTSQADVNEIRVLPNDDAGETLSRFHSATPCVDTDQGRLLLAVNDNTRTDATKTILIYDLASVLGEFAEHGDATGVLPISTIRRPPLDPEGQVTQGIAATGSYIYVLTGYYQPFSQTRVLVLDYAGNLVRTVPVAGSLNLYTMEELRDHGSYGTPYQFEPEDLSLTDTGEILVCNLDQWHTDDPIVTFEGSNYSAIRTSLGTSESPRNDLNWVPTYKAATHGAWGSATTYTVGSTYGRNAKEVWAVRSAGEAGAPGEYQLNGQAYFEPSMAMYPGGRTAVDNSCLPGEYIAWAEWSPNTRGYTERLVLQTNGLRLHDSRPGSDNTAYGWWGYWTSGGREYTYLRAAGASVASGAGIDLYGANDSTVPNRFRLHPGQASGVYFEGTGTEFRQNGGANLGRSDVPWPVAFIGLLRLTPTTVANLPAAASHTGGVAYCSNGDAGNPCLAVSDGTNWLRVALGAPVSAV